MPNKSYTETLPGGTTFEMLFVAGGEFRMGADEKSDPEAQADEQPVHKVRVSHFSPYPRLLDKASKKPEFFNKSTLYYIAYASKIKQRI